jgi:type I restriction enzyme S subunit
MTNGEWPKVALDEVAELNPRLAETLTSDAAVSFVPMSAVSAETAGITDEETRTYAQVAKGFTPFVSGDVLVAKITPCFENGKIVQARLTQRVGFGSTEFHVVRPRANKLDARYTLHFLRRGNVRLAGERRMTGSAGQRRVPENFLAKLEIPLPPLAEQRRIAEVLDRAEALRAKRRAALAQLDSLTQSLFLDLFGDPATNPKGFPKKRLAELVRDDDTINYGVVQPGDDLDEGVPLVRVGDLIEGKVRHSELKRIAPSIEAAYKRSRLRGDEILVSCVGSIGVVALANESVKGFNIARAVARIPLAESASRLFMAAYLSTDFVQRYFTNELRTVSQPTLNIKQLSETIVVLPPIELQREFARRVTAVETLKTTQRASLAELDALFATLQHRAFRGEL